MRKNLTIICVLLLVASMAAMAQWTEVRAYSPFTSVKVSQHLYGNHGVVVDPDGKIWTSPYEATDTITIGSGTLQKRREIFVFFKDGTPAPFSPIKTITIGGVTDSLNNDNSCRGLSKDTDGNILYSSFNRVFKLDYKTGEGLAKIDPAGGGSITAAQTDANGYLYVGRVAAGLPVRIYDAAYQFLANAIDTSLGILRTLAITSDGTKLYTPVIFRTSNKIFVYENALGPGFGTYTLIDSVLEGVQCECMAWQPRGDKPPLLWVSSGSRNNMPDTTKYRLKTWYGFDIDAKQIVDSIYWGNTFPTNPLYDDTVSLGWGDVRPRGIAFTPTGDTAFVAMYMADVNSVKMFVKAPTGVAPVSSVVPEGYTLSQNYPNPFNPSTEIEFSLPKAGMAAIVVYDMLGKEVMTLVNENLGAGTYKTRLDGSRLSSGTYMYVLTSNGVRISKKMMLIK